jgi:uncharacterized integral membrane protein
MPRNSIYALILIAALVVIFLFNRGRVDVNLVAAQFSMMKSLAFLLFTGLGVLIGVLLK